MNLPASVLHHESLTALETLQGPPLWIGDGKLLDAPGSYWGAAAVELHSAPALGQGIDPARTGIEHRQLAERIVRGLRGWENLGALELRYIWGQGGGRERLRLLFIARTVGAQLESARAWATQMLHNTVAMFPPGYEFGAIREPMPHDITAWAEIERAEETRQPGPFVPPGSVGYYYLIHPLGGSGSGWPHLARALAALDQPGFLSVAFVPTSLTDLERQAIDHVCSIASYLSQPQQTYDFFGNPRVDPPDAGAEAVYRAWQRFPERSGVLARIGVAAPARELHRIASLVGSLITEGSDDLGSLLPQKFKIVRELGDYDTWRTATLGLPFPRSQHPVWSLPDEQAPVTLERMPYFFSEQEAGGLFMLPVPDAQGVPGIPLSRRAIDHRETVTVNEPVVDGLRLGSALHRGMGGSPIVLPLSVIPRHTLVVGEPGSGKTTTVLSLLTQLWRDHGIPFLAIEPVKTEYRSLLGTPGLEDLRVITLGNESVSPLRLNPLEPPPGVRCEVHQSAVTASIKMALPLFPPQPELLAKALPETYYRAGWDDDTTVSDGVPAPTLRDLMNAYQAVFDKAGYTGEARNVGVAFRVRLESLLQGSRGRMLDTMRSSDFAELLSKPVIIEMNDISDADEKAVLAAFLLSRVRAAAKRRGSTEGRLKHVTVIEEAHRLLAKANAGTGDAALGTQTKADSIRAFCEAIAELRGQGEGFILSSQFPSALADAAVANTGTRILHRMEKSEDRKVMLDDFDADERTRAIAARLKLGEAVIRWPERDEVELIQVEPAQGVNSGRQVPDDAVGDHMRDHRRQTTHMLPFGLCTQEICTVGCRSGVRRIGTQLAEVVGPSARELWQGAPGVNGKVEAIVGLLAKETLHDDVQQTYCGAVHLSLNGDALRVTPGIDDRPALIQAVRRVAGNGQQ